MNFSNARRCSRVPFVGVNPMEAAGIPAVAGCAGPSHCPARPGEPPNSMACRGFAELAGCGFAGREGRLDGPLRIRRCETSNEQLPLEMERQEASIRWAAAHSM